MQLIKICKSWSFDGGRIDVLKGIDLDIYAGQSLAIVGPSGAGKSTLLHIMGFLTPADSGTIRYLGQKIDMDKGINWNEELRRGIGFVFQDAKLIPNLNVIDNVCVPLLHRGIWQSRQRAIAMEIIEKVGLSHRFKHKPNQLSGGELMRAAIARALVLKPWLLLADEPTGTLDSKTGQIITSLLLDTVQEDRALVIITHHLPLANQTDRTVSIRDGRVHS